MKTATPGIPAHALIRRSEPSPTVVWCCDCQLRLADCVILGLPRCLPCLAAAESPEVLAAVKRLLGR